MQPFLQLLPTSQVKNSFYFMIQIFKSELLLFTVGYFQITQTGGNSLPTCSSSSIGLPAPSSSLSNTICRDIVQT